MPSETIDILGTNYKIIIKKYKDEEYFERFKIAGYCDGYAKEIVVCDMSTWKDCEKEGKETIYPYQNSLIRHEIVHAFLNESGLMQNALPNDDCAWSRNEEMIDWIALQGMKIYAAWEKAECL